MLPHPAWDKTSVIVQERVILCQLASVLGDIAGHILFASRDIISGTETGKILYVESTGRQRRIKWSLTEHGPS